MEGVTLLFDSFESCMSLDAEVYALLTDYLECHL
jgi:hypothetical protein